MSEKAQIERKSTPFELILADLTNEVLRSESASREVKEKLHTILLEPECVDKEGGNVKSTSDLVGQLRDLINRLYVANNVHFSNINKLKEVF